MTLQALAQLGMVFGLGWLAGIVTVAWIETRED